MLPPAGIDGNLIVIASLSVPGGRVVRDDAGRGPVS